MQKDNLKNDNPTDANNVLAPVFTYLFSFKYWQYDPPRYILVYAKNEEEARLLGAKKCYFNSGQIASPEDLVLCTYGL
jgi:hypothetical protein